MKFSSCIPASNFRGEEVVLSHQVQRDGSPEKRVNKRENEQLKIKQTYALNLKRLKRSQNCG